MKRSEWRAIIHRVVLGGDHRWVTDDNVVGICVGRKQAGGRRGPLCLQVLVKEKRTRGAMADEYFVPPSLRASRSKGAADVVTDVRQVGRCSPDALISGNRPARPGYAMGGRFSGEGTIGCAVRDGASRLLGLSCVHVVSDDLSAATGDEVLVPSKAQADALGVAKPRLGTLATRGPIGFSDGDAPTNLDAATFLPKNADEFVPEIALWGGRPSGIAPDVKVGKRVLKVGSATELTYGEVVGVLASVRIPYATSNGVQIATFLDQIAVSSFTANGDSGSLVMTEDGEAVGLHFASAEGVSVCTPIETVLAGLSVSLA
jgi:hypothetical protein